MAKGRQTGISGSAVLFGTAGLYLVYVGVKDVPFFDGLRSILRKEKPQPTNIHSPYSIAPIVSGALGGLSQYVSGDTLGLEGNALAALSQLRSFNLPMLGRGARPENPTSDHPKGKAIDVMTTDNTTAQNIIKTFKGQAGAKYWIWNRKIGHITRLWVPTAYTGSNPHTDHVHLSYY